MLSIKEISKVLRRSAIELGIKKSNLPEKSIKLLAEISGGDARVAIGNLELAEQLSKGKITPELIKTAAQTRVPGYDKSGESHYNLVSAFIKSMRGSDANAALYYLARMLEAGEDPKFIARRMIIFSSEDIGIAANSALTLAVSTFQAVERIGMPECEYNLYHCASVLAKCKKSRAVSNAMQAAKSAAKSFPDLPVPLHLRNAPTKLMKDLGYGKDYEWEANFKVAGGFLPEEISNLELF